MREQILTFLEKNSRIDLGELAVMLGSSEEIIANEVAKMQEEGIICGYHTLIDWEKTNVDKVTALIEVRVTPQREWDLTASPSGSTTIPKYSPCT